MNQINLLLIGVGPHARRIYVPGIKKLKNEYNVNLSLAVDLVSQKSVIEDYLSEKKYKLEMMYIEPFIPEKGLPIALKNRLNKIVKEKKIDAIIISVEPRAHVCYAEWALSQGLHILMDKPISTHQDVVNSLDKANEIYLDYQHLLNLYQKLQTKKQTLFSINSQRRFHLGMRKVFSAIKEVSEKFNIPLTSISSSHNDGQWYLPIEIKQRKNHPLNEGYGKCSHSGYHFFDTAYNFYKASLIPDKSPDEIEVFSSFLQPRGFIKVINQSDYLNYFGKKYEKYTQNYTQEDLLEEFKGYGELDAMSLIKLKKNGDTICNISINLNHNSFSRRSWMQQAKDLYKGNGRVKHEHHLIQQGPFQAIHIHSYQANDKHEQNDNADYQPGGNNHFDVFIFRNVDFFGLDEKPFQKFSVNELDENNILSSNGLAIEQMKILVIKEFLDFISGKITKDETLSNIDDHQVPVQIMSSIYKSHIHQQAGKHPLITFPVDL